MQQTSRGTAGTRAGQGDDPHAVQDRPICARCCGGIRRGFRGPPARCRADDRGQRGRDRQNRHPPDRCTGARSCRSADHHPDRTGRQLHDAGSRWRSPRPPHPVGGDPPAGQPATGRRRAVRMVLVQRQPRAFPPTPARLLDGRGAVRRPPPSEAQALVPALVACGQISPNTYGRHLLAATVGTQVSPAFALAVIAVESSAAERGRQPRGRAGTDATHPGHGGAVRRRRPVPTRPRTSAGGVAYLDWLMEEFDRDHRARSGRLQCRRRRRPPRGRGCRTYTETRKITVPRSSRRMAGRPVRCASRAPHLVSDGCVFQPDRGELGFPASRPVRRRCRPIRDAAAPCARTKGQSGVIFTPPSARASATTRSTSRRPAPVPRIASGTPV